MLHTGRNRAVTMTVGRAGWVLGSVQVLGLVGTNGIGKSTALKILAGKLKPNLGMYNNPPDWQDILTYFRGSELQVRGKLQPPQLRQGGKSLLHSSHWSQLSSLTFRTISLASPNGRSSSYLGSPSP